MLAKRLRAVLGALMTAVLSTTLMVPSVACAQETAPATMTLAPTASQSATATSSSVSPTASQDAAATAPAVTNDDAQATVPAATNETVATTASTVKNETAATTSAAGSSQAAAAPATQNTSDATRDTGLVVTDNDVAHQAAINEISQAVSTSASGTLSTQSTAAAQTSSLPSSYDLRNVNGTSYIGPVRVQNPWGCCWAFGNTASIESYILKRTGGADTSTLNLSERQLAYFAGVPVNAQTVIAGRGVDSDQYGEGVLSNLNTGGQASMAAEILTSWEGLASETGAQGIPYTAKDGTVTKSSDWALAESQRDWNVVRVTDMDELPSPADLVINAEGTGYIYKGYNAAGTAAIKQTIMDKGAVSIGFYADVSQPGQASVATANFNYATGAQYVDQFITPNHGVSIVGWNDDYDASNFQTAPQGNGAFLCRNSWGSYGAYEQMTIHAGGLTDTVNQTTYTDASGNTSNVYYIAGILIPVLADGTIDTDHVIAKNLKVLNDDHTNPVYVDENGTEYPVHTVQKAGTAGSPTWDGYFWLSYYDKTIMQPVSYTADIPTSSGTYANDHIYEYDYLGLSSGASMKEGALDTASQEGSSSASSAKDVIAQAANVFTSVGNEVLTAVSVSTQSAASQVQIFIYRLINGATSPTQSATGQPEVSMTTTIANSGYHTVNLTKPLYLHAGESFSVVEAIKGAQGGYVPIEFGIASLVTVTGETMSYQAKKGSGESYISTDGGKTWVDVSTLDLSYFDGKTTGAATSFGNVMIRAYTKDWTPEPTPTPTPVAPTPATPATPTATATTASYAPAAAAAVQAELPKTADSTTDVCALLMLLAAAGMGTAVLARRKGIAHNTGGIRR